MKVVVPYRPGKLFGRTYDAARAWEGGCEFVPLRNAEQSERRADHYNPTYHELIADICSKYAKDGVIMLEQDVVPYENSILEIASCPRPWCGYAYPDGGGVSKSGLNLGCTKLSSELLAAIAIWAEGSRHGVKWRYCDGYLSSWATTAQIAPCRHYPDIAHRATRHTGKDHWLGNEFVGLDASGVPCDGRRTPHLPLQPPSNANSAPPRTDQHRVTVEQIEHMPGAKLEPAGKLLLGYWERAHRDKEYEEVQRSPYYEGDPRRLGAVRAIVSSNSPHTMSAASVAAFEHLKALRADPDGSHS